LASAPARMSPQGRHRAHDLQSRAGRVLRLPTRRARCLGRFSAFIAALIVPAPNVARIGSAAATLHVVASVVRHFISQVNPYSHHVLLIIYFCSPSTCMTPEFCRVLTKRFLNSSLDQNGSSEVLQMAFRSPWWYTHPLFSGCDM
jgi:hypothetical protein